MFSTAFCKYPHEIQILDKIIFVNHFRLVSFVVYNTGMFLCVSEYVYICLCVLKIYLYDRKMDRVVPSQTLDRQTLDTTNPRYG